MAAIRPARADDHPAILKLWHQGWHEAHAHLVPPALLAFRTPEHFSVWLEECTDAFYVADDNGVVGGFVSVKGSEVVKLYVAADARGGGIAARLLAHGEAVLAEAGVAEAMLLCTAGNRRAERFYARNGWELTSTRDDALWLPAGIAGAFSIATHRFAKQLG